jgi:enoyl-CoA hydratase
MTTTLEQHYQNLKVERRDAVTVLTVSRPAVLNALNRETLAEIEQAVQRFVADPQSRALIVTGAGEKSFISGADINELAVLDPRGAEEISRFGQRVVAHLEHSPKPTIAAINGYAFGGGLELALACHMRLASDNAVMGLPEVGLGIIPGYGGTQRLPRVVGRGLAYELVTSGRRIKAEEAARIGLVNRVLPQAELMGEALKVAEAIAKNAPLAVQAALEAVTRGSEIGLEDGLRLESSFFGVLASTQDMHEGLKAFLEKRPPQYHAK